MNSLLAAAWTAVKVGCGTREVSVPANSALVPRRWRPLAPMRTMVSGLS